MAFLVVNGYTIPVASVKRSDRLVGGKGHAFDGTPQTQDRGRKQVFECTTPPLIEQTRQAIMGIIRGDGFVFPWDSDLYSHKGIGPATGLDQATQHDYLAGDGDPVTRMVYLVTAAASPYTPTRNGNLSVDVDTTNLLTAEQRDAENAPSGYRALDAANLSADTSSYWQGTKSCKVVLTDVESGLETDPYDPGASSDGDTFVASVYIKTDTPAATVGDFHVSLYDQTNADEGTIVDVTMLTSEWVRVAAIITIGGVACRDLRLRVRVDSTFGAATFYCDGFQIEEQDYPTAWVDGARGGADDLGYDLDTNYSWVDWSVGIWFWGPVVARQPAVDGTIWQIGATSTSTPYVKLWRRNAAPDLIRLTIFDGTTTVDMDTGAGDVDWEAWNFFGVSHRTDPETGETRLVVRRINSSGSETYTDATTLTFVLDAVAALYVGNIATADHWIGHMSEFILFPFAVPVEVWDGIATTLGQAGDGSAAAIPLPQWPRKLVTGDAVVSQPIGSSARLYGALFEGESNDVQMVYGSGRTNLGRVSFTLEQV